MEPANALTSNRSLSAVVLTYNEERHITDCLRTLQWADETLIFDSYSTDHTVALATETGARVLQNPFRNFAQQRNSALAAVDTDWVFFVDADERCTDELAHEVRRVLDNDAHAVWAVPRDNYLFGKLTRGAGWYPDHQARLFRVGQASFDPSREVHEVAVYDGTMGYLTHTLIHYNYETVQQFHQKQQRYSQLEAGIMYKRGIRPRPHNYALQPLREFRRRFITLRGYRDGMHGLRLSLLMSYYTYDVYRRLGGLWKAQ